MIKAIKYFVCSCFLPLVFHAQNKNNNNLSPQNLPPDVHFSWMNACAGDTTCFINQTQMADTYTWTVAGGTPKSQILYTTNDTDMCFVFSGPGTYTVSLSAYNNHFVTLEEVITIDTITKASFDFVHCANIFCNHSLCASSFHWDFGDGNTSVQFSPVHQYSDTGHYNVTLIAYNGSKSDTLSQIVYINTTAYANPVFTYTVSFDTVFVHAVSNDPFTNFYWNFNDPLNSQFSFGSGRDTVHIYTDSIGKYNISLTAINACGPKFSSDSIQIIPLSIPQHLAFVSNLAIVPNPVDNGELNVYYNSFVSGEFLAGIYDPLGRIILQEYFTFLPGINGFKIPVAGLAKGAYVLTILSENTFTRKKFMVN